MYFFFFECWDIMKKKVKQKWFKHKKNQKINYKIQQNFSSGSRSNDNRSKTINFTPIASNSLSSSCWHVMLLPGGHKLINSSPISSIYIKSCPQLCKQATTTLCCFFSSSVSLALFGSNFAFISVSCLVLSFPFSISFFVYFYITHFFCRETLLSLIGWLN